MGQPEHFEDDGVVEEDGLDEASLDEAVLDGADDEALIRSVTVAETEAGERTDRFLAARLAPLSRTRIQRLVAEGQVLNGARVVGDAAERVNAADVLTLRIPPP
ncbi:MAG: RNA pseudouridine synthase, partial [Rhizobiales bacterium]|nr:RNA pseudouridine synthase [Hyphomicrobiales bacterium]